MKTTLALAAACAALLVLAAGPAPADAARDCPKQRGTLAKAPIGRVFHRGAKLYTCTTIYGQRPLTRRIGRWAPGTKVAFDGEELAWTTPLVRDGVRSDRIWAANANSGRRWLTGALAVPPTPSGDEAEERVARLVLAGSGIAWTTAGGVVALALQEAQSGPTPIGDLPSAPAFVPDDRRLLVARYDEGAVDAAQLAASLRLEVGPGEGDECGGSNPYRLTYRSAPDGEELGVTLDGYWTSSNRRACG